MWFAPLSIKGFLKAFFLEFASWLFAIGFVACVGWGFYREMNNEDKTEKECLNVGKYRKKPVVIEAVQWFEDGDHPEVKMIDLKRFEHRKRGERRCKRCSLVIDGIHGEIETLEGVHIVCPGDFIITGVAGEHYPCKPDIFEQTYNMITCSDDD